MVVYQTNFVSTMLWPISVVEWLGFLTTVRKIAGSILRSGKRPQILSAYRALHEYLIYTNEKRNQKQKLSDEVPKTQRDFRTPSGIRL